MRVWLTGGGGFIGSNIVAAAVDAGHDVVTTANSFQAPPDAGYAVDRLDMTDEAAVRSSIEAFDPDIVIHNAIMNDWHQMYADRPAAWDAYIGATRHTTAAAADAGAAYVLVSTDWVFDGTQAPADETTPPNPVNLYGVLKMASELVALETDERAAVARVSAVNGVHWARPDTPREQDRGFGYFLSTVVDALRAGEEFTVWEGDVNQVATPSLAAGMAKVESSDAYRMSQPRATPRPPPMQ